MKCETRILFCDNYPFSAGEFFFDENRFLVPADFNDDEVVQKVESYINIDEAKRQEYRRRAYDFWRENYETEKNYEVFCNIIDS